MSLTPESTDNAPEATVPPEPSRSYVFLPTFARDGSMKDFALVDSADYEWLSGWRWHKARDGYFYRNLSHKTEGKGHISMHRQILGLSKGDGLEVDHINARRSDNRRHNLRVCTRGLNGQNIAPKGESKYRGVSRHNDYRNNWFGWRAGVQVGNKRVVRYFKTEEEAAKAAVEMRAELHAFNVASREPEFAEEAA